MNIKDIFLESNNWSEFKCNLQTLSNKEKGDCFEHLTLLFLKLDPKYATLLNEVWFLSQVPTKVKQHLNLPNPDEGIDLIAQTKDGLYWSIQCKYKDDESTSITRKELSTFTDEI